AKSKRLVGQRFLQYDGPCIVHLNIGLHCFDRYLSDLRGEEPVKEIFHYEEGIKEFVDYLNEEKDTLTPVVYFSGEKEGIEVEV
ncbi:hypothetical protein, partial [Streptococcus salivarius]|uniref:hypothetical protein n=1 Tax=Streptococcus salivarius TaxID=1304 RepID=UPI001D07339E